MGSAVDGRRGTQLYGGAQGHVECGVADARQNGAWPHHGESGGHAGCRDPGAHEQCSEDGDPLGDSGMAPEADQAGGSDQQSYAPGCRQQPVGQGIAAQGAADEEDQGHVDDGGCADRDRQHGHQRPKLPSAPQQLQPLRSTATARCRVARPAQARGQYAQAGCGETGRVHGQAQPYAGCRDEHTADHRTAQCRQRTGRLVTGVRCDGHRVCGHHGKQGVQGGCGDSCQRAHHEEVRDHDRRVRDGDDGDEQAPLGEADECEHPSAVVAVDPVSGDRRDENHRRQLGEEQRRHPCALSGSCELVGEGDQGDLVSRQGYEQGAEQQQCGTARDGRARGCGDVVGGYHRCVSPLVRWSARGDDVVGRWAVDVDLGEAGR